MKGTLFYAWWMRHRCAGRPLYRNPMHRPSDRLQWISAWAWFFLTLLTVPLIGVTVLPGIADSLSSPPLQPATATVEHVDQVPYAVGPRAVAIAQMYDVRVRWVTGAGAVRQAWVRVTDPPRRGASMDIWATASGDRVTGSQPTNTRALDLTFLVINTAAAMSLLGYGAHRLLVWRLDRRRLRDWDAELRQLLTRR